jgi:hypothetical protein
MPGDYFLKCLETLAITFDGDAFAVDSTLDFYFDYCRDLPKDRLAEIQRQITRLVSGLATLEARLSVLDDR